MEKKKILLYGANGFTAGLMLEKLRALPCEVILAGRNKETIAAIAGQHGFLHRNFGLDHAPTVAKNLKDIGLVMNCAGPFNKTAIPMANGCIKAGAHYFDITGEMNVFQSLYDMTHEAQASNVCLIPGLGFDIVPSDCLSKMLADRLKASEKLSLAIVTKNTRPSHGTLKTLFLVAGLSGLSRRKNGIVRTPKDKSAKTVTMNGRAIPCIRAPLADLFCAPLSTGISHVDTYLAMPRQLEMLGPAFALVKTLSKNSLFNRLISSVIERLPNGPTPLQQEKGSAYIIGEISRGTQKLRGILKTHEPYVYTGDALIAGAKRWLTHGLAPGFQTPSLAFGADFALEVSFAKTEVQFFEDNIA